ncbi:MAG: hypothetical protein R3B06_24690 [Kofleriaceae bacterium]
MAFDQTMPPLLRALNAIDVDYADGDGMDFEPYQEFQSAEDNAAWLRAWTGNPDVDGAEYRVFGQDGTGGYAALWLVKAGADLLEQPVVFFGSEGELGVVAACFADYLWLLAAGIGPMEAVAYGSGGGASPQPDLAAFAEAHGGTPKLPVEVLGAAAAAYPDFEASIRALCR